MAAADFKERREPIEGRYGWILAVKDLASRYQLAWLSVEEATAEVVQAIYARLFAEHGPPLSGKIVPSTAAAPWRDWAGAGLHPREAAHKEISFKNRIRARGG